MAGRILVLDDEENYAEMLRDLLRENDYRVDMATRPELAIEQLEEIPYDLVISDYKMPVMDGADFLKKARELYPNLPVILVSGLMNTPELVKVANMSVTLVMEKPLDTQAFLRHVARFSTPMTAAEKEALEHEKGEAEAGSTAGGYRYPEEPRFYRAVSSMAKRFLQDLWTIAEKNGSCFIYEPKGGDGMLAMKDLSGWLGNRDLPVRTFDMDALRGGGSHVLEEVLSDDSCSNLVVVHLSGREEIEEARRLLKNDWAGLVANQSLFLACLVEAELSKPEFRASAGENGSINPPLALRAPDAAEYASRFARMGAERLGKSQCARFTNEAAYGILASEWPGNRDQVRELVSAALEKSADGPLELALLSEGLGVALDDVPPPKDRLHALMSLWQRRYVRECRMSRDLSVREIAEELKLDPRPANEAELDAFPLIKPELADL
ncbi:MAG: response regulator [Opitutales bacterium]